MKQKALITGSGGLIGGILMNGLADSYELYGLDLRTDARNPNFLQADITQPEQLEAAFERMPSLEYVVHLAGDARVEADWQSAFHNNIGGTKNIYAAAERHGVRRVVYASSNHATGAYEGFPPSLHTREQAGVITTRDAVRPDSFYGVSKIAGEAIARMYYELYGVESICLRIGSVTRDDDPTANPRLRATWLSHRDLVQLVACSLQAGVAFGIYYGISGNRRRFWDISDAERDLDYHPQDDASQH
jgi:nucleoside-diphosphate-sugar epimerase